MDRGIAEKVKLSKSLKVYRIQLRSLLDKLLAGKERCASKRRAVENGLVPWTCAKIGPVSQNTCRNL